MLWNIPSTHETILCIFFLGVCGSTPSAGTVSETYGKFNEFSHVFLPLLSSHIQLHVIGEFLAYK